MKTTTHGFFMRQNNFEEGHVSVDFKVDKRLIMSCTHVVQWLKTRRGAVYFNTLNSNAPMRHLYGVIHELTFIILHSFPIFTFPSNLILSL